MNEMIEVIIQASRVVDAVLNWQDIEKKITKSIE